MKEKMMGIFKEEVNSLEEMASRQSRIFSDSCDEGVAATRSVKKQMRHILESLLPLPGSKVEFKMDGKITQRSYRLEVQFAYDEPPFVYHVNYYNDRKKEFFSIY